MSTDLVTKEVRRANDLVRLAVDPGAAEGEARNAALQACRLIAKHELILLARMPEAPRAAPPPRAARPSPSVNVPPGGRMIRSRFESNCRVCNELIEVGDSIWWVPNRGSAHMECIA